MVMKSAVKHLNVVYHLVSVLGFGHAQSGPGC